MIGGLPETQEMLDFCGKHNIVSDIEMITIEQVNEAYDRLLKGDVKYRFVIDMASLKKWWYATDKTNASLICFNQGCMSVISNFQTKNYFFTLRVLT